MRPASPSTGALLPTMSIQTYVHVHGPHSLVPVAGWSRCPSPPSSHLAAAATAAWRLIRVSFQAILLRGGRLTARSLHHSLYLWARSRSAVHVCAAATGLLSTLQLCCLLHTCCRVSAHALRCYMYLCCTLPLPTLSFRLPPQHDASIDALAHKRNQPSPTLADGLISRTDCLLLRLLLDTPSKCQPPKPRHIL